jgi:CubicO group peptidase (beta-lactamase class C family)
MKKHRKKIIALGILLLLSGGLYYIYLRFPVITGYAAKNMCSCVFIADRKEKDVLSEELNFSFIKYANVNVDYEQKKVTATLLGVGEKTAYYHPQKGCALVDEEDLNDFMQNVPAILSGEPTDIALPMSAEDTFVNYEKLKMVIDHHFEDANPEKPYGTRAVVILHKGHIIAEKYADRFNENSLHLGWSMTKSIFSALIGIAIQDGIISGIDRNQLFPEWTDSRKEITLKSLLQMNSGLDWEENYGNLSGVTLMLYNEGDMVGFVAKRGMEGEMGKHFEYSSGSSNLISGFLRKQMANYEDYFSFPYVRLFQRIGAHSFRLETDANGSYVASSYAWATARDWARFGQLYLDKGRVGDDQLFDENWVKFTTESAEGSEGSYGAQFWLPTKDEFPDSPSDMFYADGFQGQRIFIVPSKDLVIVRLGLTRFEQPDYNELVKGVVEAIE